MATTKKSEFQQFDEMKDEDLKSLSGFDRDYAELEVNSKYTFKFTGMGEFTSEKGNVPAVLLEDEEGTQLIHASTVLVNNLKKVEPPCMVRILTKRMERSKSGGSYLDMDILVLPSSKK